MDNDGVFVAADADALRPFHVALVPVAHVLMLVRHLIMEEAVVKLPEREARILQMRFGLGLKQDYTLEEVGKEFGVTRERIRQIEAKALRMIRESEYGDVLKVFLEDLNL